MNTDDRHSLTGAYALDALSDEERRAYERHLAECASCREEVTALSETTARLGLAASAPVPPSLQEDVLRRIAQVQQVPPAVSAAPAQAAPLRGRSRRGPLWALAASIASAVLLGGTAVVQHNLAQDAEQETQRVEQAAGEVAAVLAAPDARLTTTGLPQGATGTVVVSRSLDRAVFTAADLAEPPSGKVYQLWFNDRGTMRPAGLIDPDHTTTAMVMDGPVEGATGMGVTLEPAGGSARPTSPPIALATFPAA
ncbi:MULTISPECIES: anti-sigma factor domain-containing protein [Streptomyces]|uniref:Regulator of SigK n=1 Tax=Streptomyces venezuelae TaxID=54571 RepID=A0A5P2ALS8_STRVZ|nr:anti-sigma factor [Streptomyces venezuelae]QES17831.1 anti-sigma factor [Streptomyces venezuelae]